MLKIVVAMTLLLPGLVTAQAPRAPVAVDVVRGEAVEAMQTATGAIYAREELLLRAPVAGRLAWILEAGQWAQEGQDLARIDATPLVLQREEQLARIRRSQVQLKNLDTRLQRYTELKAEDYATDVELDDLRAQRDLARADLDIARAQVRQLDDRIARATIRAPFDGVVTAQNRHAAEEVAQGEELARIVNVSEVELRAQLPLSWLSRLKAGDVLEASGAGHTLLGTIRSLIPDGNRMAQTFEARIDLPPEAAQIWAPGQLADVRLPTALLDQALLVPRDALVLRREAKYVYRITPDSTAEQVKVTLGPGRGEWIVVQGELSPGDRVAVRGAERLSNGQAVEVVRDLAAERNPQPS